MSVIVIDGEIYYTVKKFNVGSGRMNYLKAVFWDYPQFADKEKLLKFIQDNKGTGPYFWTLTRFLEHGRVVDALSFFKLSEISEKLPKLILSGYARRKWERLLEVYGENPGK